MTKRRPTPSDAALPSGIAYLVGRLERLVRRRLGEELASEGLSVQQYTIMAVLGARGQASNAQLAERAFVTPQTANEMVKALEERGWIDRSPDPHHGRIVQLRLTRAGQQALARAHAAAAAVEARMLAGVSAPDREKLAALLRHAVHGLAAIVSAGA